MKLFCNFAECANIRLPFCAKKPVRIKLEIKKRKREKKLETKVQILKPKQSSPLWKTFRN